MALPPGFAPTRSNSCARIPEMGKVEPTTGWISRRNARVCAVSRNRSTTPSTCPSRCLRATRRSVACPSRGAVSASTPYRQSRARMNPSHARESPLTGRGTSTAHSIEGCSRARKSRRSSRCAASRIGSPPGYALIDRSSPMTAHIRARSITSTWSRTPRSTRLPVAAEHPIARPTSLSVRFRSTLAWRISAPIEARNRRPRSVPRSTGLVRVVMSRSWPRLLSCQLHGEQRLHPENTSLL